MAEQIQAKQIEKYQQARMGVSGFSAVGTSDVVTSEITTSASSDGVPVQVGSGSTEGFITTGANNKVLIYDDTTKSAIDDGFGNEVYGRLTEAGAVYTLSYYSLQSGVETAVTLTATDIGFLVAYNYRFSTLPSDALIRVNTVAVGNDPGTGSGIRKVEVLTVTATNTISDLSKTPISGTVEIFVNSAGSYTEGVSFSISGKAVTWIPAGAEFSVETTDTVKAAYNTLEL